MLREHLGDPAMVGGRKPCRVHRSDESSPARTGRSSPVAGKQTRVCLGVATAPHWRGPYTRLRPDPILPCPVDSFDFEDPSLFYDARHGAFHLIVKDFKGTVTHAGCVAQRARGAGGGAFTSQRAAHAGIAARTPSARTRCTGTSPRRR